MVALRAKFNQRACDCFVMNGEKIDSLDLVKSRMKAEQTFLN